MIPAGYMLKEIRSRPESLKAPAVVDIYSVSGCVAKYFAHYIGFWEHNGYWLFDAPEIVCALAERTHAKLDELHLFYYEVYDRQYDEKGKTWRPFGPEPSLKTEVKPPEIIQPAGYDVVSFFAQTSPECSPLSCNSLAESLKVNAHCLLNSFEKAKQALEHGLFDNTEPGPFRVFAVYRIT